MLAGCSPGSRYLSENYSRSPQVLFQGEQATWSVVDKPESGRIVLWRGFASPAPAPPRPEYERTAVAYLAKTGRRCRILDGLPVAGHIWELTYTCDGAAVVASAPPPRR